MNEYKWIAEQSFRCVTAKGEVISTVVRIGEPVNIAAEGDLQGYSQCRLALAPLAADRWIAAVNSFQALCLTLDHLRTVFKVILADGGRIYWEDTDSHIDVDSPWFAPRPSLAGLRQPRDA